MPQSRYPKHVSTFDYSTFDRRAFMEYLCDWDDATRKTPIVVPPKVVAWWDIREPTSKSLKTLTNLAGRIVKKKAKKDLGIENIPKKNAKKNLGIENIPRKKNLGIENVPIR